MQAPVSTRLLVSLALVAMLVGVCTIGVARWLIGQGHLNELATEVQAAIVIGWVAVALGAIGIVALGIMVAGDRIGLWAVLNRPLVAEAHPISRLVRGTIRFHGLWELLVAGGVLCLVVVGFLFDPLMRMILGITAGVAFLLYWFLRRRPDRSD
ncbi:hypothetical protein ABI59_18595 [Acidobacteria bacterium Mor1]|nr:hypothetical protein ABI59_18595 [Acidobacteria bacterium Mor1]